MPDQRVSRWGAKGEIRIMTTMPDREIVLKVAGIQAAATLIAGRDTGKERLDVVREECAKHAALGNTLSPTMAKNG
jgi:hypothetical protein